MIEQQLLILIAIVLASTVPTKIDLDMNEIERNEILPISWWPIFPTRVQNRVHDLHSEEIRFNQLKSCTCHASPGSPSSNDPTLFTTLYRSCIMGVNARLKVNVIRPENVLSKI